MHKKKLLYIIIIKKSALEAIASNFFPHFLIDNTMSIIESNNFSISVIKRICIKKKKNFTREVKDLTDCNNYRDISLINVGLKIISKIVTNRIAKYALEHKFVRPEQFEFRNKEECISLLYFN